MSESVYKLADGTWRGKVLIGTRWKYVRAKTKREAQEKLDALKVKHAQQHPVFTKRQTMEEYLRFWLAHEVNNRVRPTTHEMYTVAVNRMVPHIGTIQLAKFTRQHMLALVTALRAETTADGAPRYAPRTIERAIHTLRNALNSAVDNKLIGSNPVHKIPVKIESYEPRVLSVEEIDQLFAVVAGDRLEALYRLAIQLGLRKGELLGLRWKDIDFEAQTLHVRQQSIMVNSRPQLGPLKTKHARRVIDLPSSLCRALHQRRAEQLSERTLAGTRWQEQDLVFSTELGTLLQHSNLTRHFKAVIERMGLPRNTVRFHDLRHTFVTLLLAKGESVRVVQEIVGHSDPQTTQRVYQSVSDDQKRRAVQQLDTLLLDTRKVS